MPTNSDDVYRKNLREKLGLGEKVTTEEAPIEAPVENAELAEVEPKEEAEKTNPAAEAIINELLQYVHEKDNKAPDAISKRMVKGLWVYLIDNKDKIVKDMVGKAEKAKKVI